jgi:hypothetical protein
MWQQTNSGPQLHPHATQFSNDGQNPLLLFFIFKNKTKLEIYIYIYIYNLNNNITIFLKILNFDM